MELPENFTDDMIDMELKNAVRDDKENDFPPAEESKKRIRFIMSGVSDDERNK